MNLTFAGGTAQQQQWVNDAIARCTFDFAALGVNVVVSFTNLSNCSLSHTYMCTSGSAPDFQIQIVPWADDPRAPGVQGLTDPAADVHEFFMDSFIHEIGHVLAFTDVTDLQALCQCFTHIPDGRRGVASDYFSAGEATNHQWEELIVEATAEWFRLAFLPLTQCYWNRTNWEISAADWPTFMALLLPGAGGEGPETDLGFATIDVPLGPLAFDPTNCGFSTVGPAGYIGQFSNLAEAGLNWQALFDPAAAITNMSIHETVDYLYGETPGSPGGGPVLVLHPASFGAFGDTNIVDTSSHTTNPFTFDLDGSHFDTCGRPLVTFPGSNSSSTDSGEVAVQRDVTFDDELGGGPQVRFPPVGIGYEFVFVLANTYAIVTWQLRIHAWGTFAISAPPPPYPMRDHPGSISAGPGLRGAVTQAEVALSGRLALSQQALLANGALTASQSLLQRGSAQSGATNRGAIVHSH